MTNLLASGKQARIVGKFDVARHGELIAYTGESFISQQTAKGRSYMRTTRTTRPSRGGGRARTSTSVSRPEVRPSRSAIVESWYLNSATAD